MGTSSFQQAVNGYGKIKLVVVLGPTASGKTGVAVRLAERFGGEITSVDSRQVYRGMDIGTGKDLSEYSLPDGRRVPYHLIDIADPGEDYNLKRFLDDAAAALAGIMARGAVPFLAGGTALYLDALLRGYELPGGGPDADWRRVVAGRTAAEILAAAPAAAATAVKDTGNRSRLVRELERLAGGGPSVEPIAGQLDPLVIGVLRHRSEIHARIEERLDARLAAGMLEEVRGLREGGLSWERLDYFGLEYRHVATHLRGETDFRGMRGKLLVAIRQFAKRQDIWFRKMEREGLPIHWIPGGDFDQCSELVGGFLAGGARPRPAIRLDDIRYGPKSN